MKVYIIPQKMSGTGNIHDIASQHYDREIKFRKGCKYAIVWASYYGGNCYRTFKSEEACVKVANIVEESFSIIDSDGNRYVVNYDRLERLDY